MQVSETSCEEGESCKTSGEDRDIASLDINPELSPSGQLKSIPALLPQSPTFRSRGRLKASPSSSSGSPELPAVPDSARGLPQRELAVAQAQAASLNSQCSAQQGNTQPPSSAPDTVELHLPEDIVRLNVYDLHKSVISVNDFLDQAFGAGAFHIGVEVYGVEYMYSGATGETQTERLRRVLGMRDEEEEEFDALALTGIIRHLPRKHLVHVFKQQIVMGPTTHTRREVHEMVQQLGREYTRGDYSIIRNNCVHFANRLSASLGVGTVPERFFGACFTVSGGIDGVSDAIDIVKKNSMDFLSGFWACSESSSGPSDRGKGQIVLYGCGGNLEISDAPAAATAASTEVPLIAAPSVVKAEEEDSGEVWCAPGCTAQGGQSKPESEHQRLADRLFPDLCDVTLEKEDHASLCPSKPWTSVPSESNVAGTIQHLDRSSLGASRRSSAKRTVKLEARKSGLLTESRIPMQ